MKNSSTVILLCLFAFSTLSFICNAGDKTKADVKSEMKSIEVYYFHGTRRCETCKAVGVVSKELVKNKYGDNSNVKFVEINIDEPGNEELVKKFQVSGSGLYIYNGHEIVNITVFAFQYAISNPDNLKNKLIQLINRNL